MSGPFIDDVVEGDLGRRAAKLQGAACARAAVGP